MNIGDEYLKVIQERLKAVKALGDKTIQQLSEKDIHYSSDEFSNSIAIIVKHMSGNMISRWTDFLTADGEKIYRRRDDEFIDDIASKEDMLFIWEKGWQTFFEAIDHLESDDLLRNVYIRGESLTVIEAVERQLAHYSYHVGQLVYIGKMMKGEYWESLSIKRGESEEYMKRMQERYRTEE